MTRRRLGLITGLATLLVAPLIGSTMGAPSAAAAAGGDSIVYLKGGRVWVAHADGTGARAFTTGTYNWSSPSMDDHGNVVVVGGLARVNPGGTDSDGSSEIYRFRPDGNQLGRPIPTWGSYSTPACPTYGPVSTRVSPDGSKVAYGIWDCAAFSFTALWTPITSRGLNFPNQSLGQEDFYEPQWVDSSQFVVSHVGMTLTDDTARWFDHPTSGADYTGWGWADSRITGTGAQALISRDGTTFAVFSDDAADHTDGKPRHLDLFLYSSPSLAHAESNGWHLDCTVALSAANTSEPLYLSPSFSTDGTKIYWGDDKGVQVAKISDRSNSCANVHPTLLIPGGSQPYVSPAGLHAPAREPIQPGAHYSPHASFAFTPAHPRSGGPVTLDGRASHETLGRIVRYTWRFGDGHSATGRVVSHRFARHGTYHVRLVVTDKRGKSDALTRSVRVTRR